MYYFLLSTQNFTQLIVNVNNVDDNVPMFLDPSYTGSVPEGQPIGTQVAVVSDDEYTYTILVMHVPSLKTTRNSLSPTKEEC